MPTLKQMAASELMNATQDYCDIIRNFENRKADFVPASLRLHIARGGNVTRSLVRASRSEVRAAQAN